MLTLKLTQCNKEAGDYLPAFLETGTYILLIASAGVFQGGRAKGFVNVTLWKERHTLELDECSWWLLAPCTSVLNGEYNKHEADTSTHHFSVLTGWETLSTPAACLLPSGQLDGSPFYAWDPNKRKTLSPFPFWVKCQSRCYFSPVVSSQQNHPLSMWQKTQWDFENRMGEGSWLLLEPALSRGPSHPWLPNIRSSPFPVAPSGRQMTERSLVWWPKDQGTP